MERLTERDGLVVHSKFKGDFASQNILHKLADYEGKQEQGLLIELPCKILDTLYINDFRCDYHMNFDRPYAVKVWTIVINGRNDFIDVMLEDGTMYQFYLSDIGKTIFLTKAEAESALAKMGGK